MERIIWVKIVPARVSDLVGLPGLSDAVDITLQILDVAMFRFSVRAERGNVRWCQLPGCRNSYFEDAYWISHFYDEHCDDFYKLKAELARFTMLRASRLSQGIGNKTISEINVQCCIDAMMGDSIEQIVTQNEETSEGRSENEIEPPDGKVLKHAKRPQKKKKKGKKGSRNKKNKAKTGNNHQAEVTALDEDVVDNEIDLDPELEPEPEPKHNNTIDERDTTDKITKALQALKADFANDNCSKSVKTHHHQHQKPTFISNTFPNKKSYAKSVKTGTSGSEWTVVRKTRKENKTPAEQQKAMDEEHRGAASIHAGSYKGYRGAKYMSRFTAPVED